MKNKINGAILKYIAMICMLIDHTAVILDGYFEFIFKNYTLMRSIGRIAFPIFIFLLIEGFTHTSNKRKYIRNMGMFALISEIPFDLAFNDRFFYLGYQNVFFTLFIGLLMLYYIEKYDNKFLNLGIILIACLIAEYILKSDYGYLGIIAIAIFYFAHNSGNLEKFIMYEIAFLFEFISFVHIANILTVYCYNGKRGKQNKWLFYIFYPVHILILYLIRLYI